MRSIARGAPTLHEKQFTAARPSRRMARHDRCSPTLDPRSLLVGLCREQPLSPTLADAGRRGRGEGGAPLPPQEVATNGSPAPGAAPLVKAIEAELTRLDSKRGPGVGRARCAKDEDCTVGTCYTQSTPGYCAASYATEGSTSECPADTVCKRIVGGPARPSNSDCNPIPDSALRGCEPVR